MNHRIILVLFILLGWASLSSAQIVPGQTSLTFLWGNYKAKAEPIPPENCEYQCHTASDRRVGTIITDVKLGYDLSPEFGLELGTQMRSLYKHVVRLDGLYYFQPDEQVVPYIAVGGGHLSVSPNLKIRNMNTVLNYGFGLKYFVRDDLVLRADMRHLVLFDDTEYIRNDFEYSIGFSVVGLEFPWKKSTKKKRKDNSQYKNEDGGRDGPPNQCPGTRLGTKVRCTIKQILTLDLNREEPEYPSVSGTKPEINTQGLCTGAPFKAKATKKGCSLQLKLNFDSNKTDIRPKDQDKLEVLAEFLNKTPTAEVFIEGYADLTGSKAYNLLLSEQRAERIVDALIDLGVDEKTLTFTGHGESESFEEEDLGKDRRVIITVLF